MVRAITLIPGQPDSAGLTELPNPQPGPGELLVAPLVLGVCGTDREILEGTHGSAPEGRERLVLGHELLARVLEAPAGSDFEPGQPVAAVVRRPDPVPCSCSLPGNGTCAATGSTPSAGSRAGTATEPSS